MTERGFSLISGAGCHDRLSARPDARGATIIIGAVRERPLQIRAEWLAKVDQSPFQVPSNHQSGSEGVEAEPRFQCRVPGQSPGTRRKMLCRHSGESRNPGLQFAFPSTSLENIPFSASFQGSALERGETPRHQRIIRPYQISSMTSARPRRASVSGRGLPVFSSQPMRR